jgi:mannose-6-phosphate isomerase-like protein (cupin superfamily)
VIKRVDKPWGHYLDLYSDDEMWLKYLYIKPGQSLSLQYHYNRDEYWRAVTPHVKAVIDTTSLELEVGKVYSVPNGVVHRLSNPTAKLAIVAEWAVGNPSEEDIVRLQDNYDRN